MRLAALAPLVKFLRHPQTLVMPPLRSLMPAVTDIPQQVTRNIQRFISFPLERNQSTSKPRLTLTGKEYSNSFSYCVVYVDRPIHPCLRNTHVRQPVSQPSQAKRKKFHEVEGHATTSNFWKAKKKKARRSPELQLHPLGERDRKHARVDTPRENRTLFTLLVKVRRARETLPRNSPPACSSSRTAVPPQE